MYAIFDMLSGDYIDSFKSQEHALRMVAGDFQRNGRASAESLMLEDGDGRMVAKGPALVSLALRKA